MDTPAPMPPAPGSPQACAADPSLRFAFIGGSRKSGTTWLLRMLAAHPHALAMGEGFFVGTSGWGLAPALDDRVFRHWAAIDDVRSSWMANLSAEEGLRIARRAMIEALMRAGAARAGKPEFAVLIDKSAYSYSRFAAELHGLFPEAWFIDIVRDGRDVAVSDVFMILAKGLGSHFPAENHEHIDRARVFHVERRGERVPLFNEWLLRRSAREWAEAVAGSAVAKRLFGERYICFRYEDLLADPRQVILAIRMLGLDASEEVVARCVAAGSFAALSGGRTAGQSDPSSFFRKGVAGDWRNHFTDADRQVFKQVAGETLIALGYAADDQW